jgi:hypothetical protein
MVKCEYTAPVSGQLQDGPANEWQTFEKTSRALPDPVHDRFYAVYCCNWSPMVTAWFDGIRIEPVAGD